MSRGNSFVLAVGNHSTCRCQGTARASPVEIMPERVTHRMIEQIIDSATRDGHMTRAAAQAVLKRNHGIEATAQSRETGLFLSTDGKLIRAIQAGDSDRRFASPISPWSLNGRQLEQLRGQVGALRTQLEQLVARGAPWAERARFERELRVDARKLQSAEYEIVVERKRQRSISDER